MTIEHPHKNVIDNMGLSQLITIIDESKTNYIKENLSIHLHSSQIKLFKEAVKHDKPHHKKIRINQYKLLKDNPDKMDKHYQIHEKIYLSRYKKLESKEIIKVTDSDELPYDIIITDKGKQILEEIKQLEDKWEKQITEDIEENDLLLSNLRQVAQKASPINYKHKKQQKFVF